MKKLAVSIFTSAALAASTAGLATNEFSADQAQITSILERYEEALNASDTSSILALYSKDGVFMAQHNQPAIGTENLSAAYNAVFESIQLDIEFQIDEIVQPSSDWAFVRTLSEGAVTIKAAGVQANEANQELFIFQKQESGDWKIARYIFSTTNPLVQ